MHIASNDRQVEMALNILSTIRTQNMNASEVQKHTSQDKSVFYFVIIQLRVEGLVDSTGIAEHRQKRVQSLSDLGKNIADLLECVEKFPGYRVAFRKARLSKLPTRLEQHEKIDNKTIRLNKLPSWKRINDTNASIIDASLLESLSFQYFINLVFYRCAEIARAAKKKHVLSRLILRYIIDKATDYYFKEITTVIENPDPVFNTGLRLGGYGSYIETIQKLPLTCATSLRNPVISEEANNLISLIFLILKPSKQSQSSM